MVNTINMTEKRESQIPLLEAGDVECRIQSAGRNKNGVGAVLLLYKNARVDMRVLDQVFGPMNWQRTHEVINGNLFCSIDIWDGIKETWIRKQDVGVESNTEKEKGQASDAFKRACFNIGIGRELYTSPFIYVSLAEGEYRVENQGQKEIIKCWPSTKFFVSHIEYNQRREISGLIITDQSGAVRYDMNRKFQKPLNPKPSASVSGGQVREPIPAAGTQQAVPPAGRMSCPACGGEITQAEWDYSARKYGQALCRSCQRKKAPEGTRA